MAPNMAEYILDIIYLFQKFIFKNNIRKIIKEFKKNRYPNFDKKEELFLFFVLAVGILFENIGYIVGVFSFNGTNWKKNNLTHINI